MARHRDVVTEFSVFCHICGNWHREQGPYSNAVKGFRAAGYKLLQKRWACKHCATEPFGVADDGNGEA